MRLFGGLFGSIYVVIGIVIANTHHYLSGGSVRGVVSAVLAVLLWPLMVLGVSLHIR